MYKPKGVELPEKYIREGARTNRHGFGIMYFDPIAKKIVVFKHAEYDINTVVKNITALKEFEVVIHFRIMTHGSIKDENCHPFRVLSKAGNAMEMWMMHNGTITGVETEGDETDSNAFIRSVMVPILKKKPGVIRVPAFQKLIKETINKSRLVFMYGSGEVTIINKEGGAERDGCWFSNHTAFPSFDYSKGYGTTRDTFQGRRGMAARRNDLSHSRVADDSDDDYEVLGIKSKKGDRVLVWDRLGDEFLGEGTFKEVNKTYSIVEIVLQNELKSVQVDNKTGESVYHETTIVANRTANVNNRYYCMPINYEDAGDYEQKTVGQITKLDDVAEDDAATKAKEAELASKEAETTGTMALDTVFSKDLRSSTQPSSGGCTTNVINLTDARDGIKVEGAGNMTQEEMDKLQDEIDERINASLSQKKAETDGKSTQLIEESFQPDFVTYKGPVETTVNATMRIGADSLESVYQDYGNDEGPVTIVDAFNMTLEERFQLYLGMPEVGFAMFNDCLDHFCLYGADYTEEDHEDWMAAMSTNDDEDDDDGSSGSGSVASASGPIDPDLDEDILDSDSVDFDVVQDRPPTANYAH